MFDQIPLELRGAAPGVAGSALALFFMRRPPFVLVGMFVGGCLVSLYATHATAEFFEMDRADGFVGFVLGVFGMALIGKLHDTIEAVSPSEVWSDVRAAIRKKLGVKE
jgi:hypothetical protein